MTGDELEAPLVPRRLGQSGTRASGVRRHNLAALLEHLHFRGSASRSELGAGLGLNRSTIADLVQELDERGLVVERGVASQSGPGRPSPPMVR